MGIVDEVLYFVLVPFLAFGKIFLIVLITATLMGAVLFVAFIFKEIVGSFVDKAKSRDWNYCLELMSKSGGSVSRYNGEYCARGSKGIAVARSKSVAGLRKQLEKMK